MLKHFHDTGAFICKELTQFMNSQVPKKTEPEACIGSPDRDIVPNEITTNITNTKSVSIDINKKNWKLNACL